jgi:hypothetical protein
LRPKTIRYGDGPDCQPSTKRAPAGGSTWCIDDADAKLRRLIREGFEEGIPGEQ